MLKKNQLAVLVIALMLITAGYLNYTSKDETLQTNANVLETAALGDATLVDSKLVEENTIETSKIENNEPEENYFVLSRLDREKMYSQMLEAYQKLIESTSISAEQKAISQQEIAKINQTKNAIMISENLIKTKGFEDVVLFVNTDSVSVIVKAKALQPEDIAKIQNIVQRELGVEASNINISNKE